VAERISQALRSQDPVTRAVAARVASLVALTSLLPDVAAALSAESDIEAAKEEARALISVGGGQFDDAVLSAAERLAPRLDRELVRMFARARGPQAVLLYNSALRNLALSPRDREAFFRLATRGERGQLVAASAQSFGGNDSASWQAILNVAAELGQKLEDPVLLEALRSGDLPFRGEAAWYLAKMHCDSPPADQEKFLTAMSEAKPVQGEDAELHFGAEILRRVLGRPPVEDEAWIACLDSNPECHLDSDFLPSPLIRFLTSRERMALARRNGANLPEEVRSEDTPKPPKLTLEQELRLVSGLPRGLVKDLFEVEGCRSGRFAYRFGFASLQFRQDGLPRHVTLLAEPPGAGCRRAAQSLFLMATAPADEHIPRDSAITYAASMTPEAMVCNEGSFLHGVHASATTPTVMRVRAKVVPPKLTKKVEPIHPETARQNREQGVSIYEAIITESGCVRELRLLRSSTVLMDVAALHAIAQWRYQPATFDGRPVSVYLTVTVRFNLH